VRSVYEIANVIKEDMRAYDLNQQKIILAYANGEVPNIN